MDSPPRAFALDDDDDDAKQKPGGLATSNPATSNPASGRYCFGLLDSRSIYGKDFFPDPLLGPEFDAEHQVEFDYAHGERRNLRADEVDAGIQWNVIGQLTLSAEFGWDSERASQDPGSRITESDDREHGSGFENVDLAVYHPLFQFVSDDGLIDYTAIARADVGIPTHTPVSGTDAVVTPYVGQLLRIGEHISVEAWTGSQFTLAPHQQNQLIYGASLGYAISHAQLPLPGEEQVVPNVEIDGQSLFSGGGQDALFGVAGIDLELSSLGRVQPTIDMGYQLPIDEGARDQLRWGVLIELLVDF